MQNASTYFETLNPEQRRAVEHGAAGGLAAPLLLVIAGAGSGKTNTPTHRVAHLREGCRPPPDPVDDVFTAGSKMTKRVQRIARKVMSDNTGVMMGALTGPAPTAASAPG